VEHLKIFALPNKFLAELARKNTLAYLAYS